jgi:hypothetical protein
VQVSDYPAVPESGVIGPWTARDDFAAAAKVYPLLTRLKWYFFSQRITRGELAQLKANGPATPSSQTAAIARAIGQALNGLGVHWTIGVKPLSEHGVATGQIDSKSDQDFAGIWTICRTILANGGGISVLYDDVRFPIHPHDVKNFGFAREADMFFLNRLYQKTKSEFPDATLSFCPPFYWGPSIHRHEESDLLYLEAIKARLPADVGVCWTGPHVKSGPITPAELARFAALIGRRPNLWQNSAEDPQRLFRYVLPGDVKSWWMHQGRDEKLYAGFRAAAVNSLGVYADMLWSAALWNPDSPPAENAREATMKLVGPENYQEVIAYMNALSWFDQFEGKITAAAAKNLPEIERRLLDLKARRARCFRKNAAALREWGWLAFERVPNALDQWVKRLKLNPLLKRFLDPAGQTGVLAGTEAGFEPTKDLLFTAAAWQGGYVPRPIFGRFATWLRGQGSQKNRLKVDFPLEPFPPSQDYALILAGRDGGNAGPCRLAVKLNDVIVFTGPNPFPRDRWSCQVFPLPRAVLRRANSLTIDNLETDAGGGLPYFAVNYGVVKTIQPKTR